MQTPPFANKEARLDTGLIAPLTETVVPVVVLAVQIKVSVEILRSERLEPQIEPQTRPQPLLRQYYLTDLPKVRRTTHYPSDF